MHTQRAECTSDCRREGCPDEEEFIKWVEPHYPPQQNNGNSLRLVRFFRRLIVEYKKHKRLGILMVIRLAIIKSK